MASRSLLENETASRIPSPGRFRERRCANSSIAYLRISKCRVLLRSFNEFQTLDVSSGERDRWNGIFLSAMAAVVHDLVEVVQYLKEVGEEFKSPKELADCDAELHLRDCVSRSPYD